MCFLLKVPKCVSKAVPRIEGPTDKSHDVIVDEAKECGVENEVYGYKEVVWISVLSGI